MRYSSVAVLLLFAVACYHYIPAEPGDVTPGDQVRARLTSAGAQAMRSYFGPRVNNVDGPLVRWDDNGVSLLVETYVTRPGFPATTVADTVRLPPGQMEALERQVVDVPRTGLAALCVVAAATAAVLATRSFGGAVHTESPPRPGNILVFRIPFP
jgi:hypothetical protein